jgi:hypothetical protein
MKTKLIFPLIFVGFWGVACGGDGARRGNNQKAYETVAEGSAAGVTSTIHGPGEVLPPVTGTNADTTTAFSIDPNVASVAAPASAQGSGTLAGTLPIQPAYPQPMTSASQPRTAYTPRPQQTQRSYPVPQPQQPRPLEEERPQPQQQPPATDTTVATAPQQQPQQQQPPAVHPNPPQQQQPPAANPKPPADEGEDAEEAEEEPPPPTTTDTRGQ